MEKTIHKITEGVPFMKLEKLITDFGELVSPKYKDIFSI